MKLSSLLTAMLPTVAFLSGCMFDDIEMVDVFIDFDLDHDSPKDTEWSDTEDTVIIDVCGDGMLQPGESCDDGNTLDGDGCPATCSEVEDGYICAIVGEPCVAICGDGIVSPESGEECDDGINAGEYGMCAPGCFIGPHCGDGILQPEYEICDDGVNDGGYGECAPGCVLGPFCGDGEIQSDYEMCDDGNTEDGDGCNTDCQLVVVVV